MNMKVINITATSTFLFLLILFGRTTIALGQNNGLNFDGIDDNIEMGGLTQFDGVTNHEFTVETWINTTQTGGDATIWSFGINTGSSLQLRKNAADQLELLDVDGIILTGSSHAFNEGRWHHTAVTYDGIDINLYLDGVLIGNVARNVNLENNLRLGESTFPNGDLWDGMMDELRIWDHSLDRTSILQNLFFELIGTETDILHYYNFNTITGGVLTDFSTNVVNGTLNNFDIVENEISEATVQQTITPAISGNWNDGGTWNGGIVPLPIDAVDITGAFNIDILSEILVFDLNIGVFSNVSQGADINILRDFSATVEGTYSAISSTTQLIFNGVNHTITLNESITLPAVVLNNDGVVFLASNVTLAGGINIMPNAILNAQGNNIIMNGGNWLDDGTFNSGSGNVLFGGTGHLIQNGNFDNLTFNSSGAITFQNDVNINEAFNVTGTATVDMGSHVINAGNAWNLDAIDTLIFMPGAQIVFDQSISGFRSGVGSNPNFNTSYPTMILESGAQLSLSGSINIADGDSIYIADGVMNLTFSDLVLGVSSKLILESGEFNATSVNFRMANNAVIENNGGDFSLEGGEGDSNLFALEPGDEYDFFQNEGSLLIRETNFQSLKGNGLEINGGEVIEFNNVDFSNSPNASAYVTINSNAFDNTVMDIVDFDAGPTNNINKTDASGNNTLIVANATGNFAGPDFHLVGPAAGQIVWPRFESTDDYALNFDDNNSDYVSIAGGVDFAGPLTIEAWIRPTELVGERSIFTWFNSPVEYISFRVSDGFLEVFSQGAMSLSSTDTQPLIDGQWVHVAYTLDAANNYLFYINGEQTSGGTYFGDPLVASSTIIGSRSGNEEFFEGDIDDIRIWSDVRMPAEIAINAFTRFEAPFPADLETFYNFDEGSGTILNDLIVAPRLGALNNFTLTNPGQSNWIQALDKPTERQHTLNFDGFNQHVELASFQFPAGDFTFETWIQPQDGTGDEVILGWGNFMDPEYASLLLNNGQPSFILNSVGGNTTITSNEILTVSQWHHVSVVKSGSSIELFVNGISKALTNTALDLTGPLFGLRIGGILQEVEVQQGFQGNIDEVRIWGLAVDVENIRDFAISENLTSHPNNGPSLLRQFSFNEGITPGGDNTGILVLPDESENNNPAGTLINFPTTLTGNSSNWVKSDAFEAINLNIVANDIVISRNADNTVSFDDNTNFGTVLLNESRTNQFLVINEGFNPISITEANFDAEFNTAFESLFIEPFDTILLDISFIPLSEGNNSGFSNISYLGNNESELFSFNISGTGYPNNLNSGQSITFNSLNVIDLSNEDNFRFNGSDPFTMEAWINTSTTGTFTIFSNVDTNTAGQGIDFAVINGQVRLRLVSDFPNGFISSLSNESIPSDMWTHIAATYNGNEGGDGIEIFFNGELQNVTRTTNPFSGVTNMNNAAPRLGQGDIDGSIDDFILHGRELTPEEIRSNLFNGADRLDIDLRAYYRFDEGTGGDVADLANLSSGTLVSLDGLDPLNLPVFNFSGAAINNNSEFDGLFDIAGLWVTNPDAQSSNLIIVNNAFLSEDGDNIIFANDNNVAGLDEYATDRITNLQPQVSEKLNRNWFIEVADSMDLGGNGGLIDIVFDNVTVDSSFTYYLLSADESISEYEIAAYRGYYSENDSVVFQIGIDELSEGRYFTLGRSLAFPGNAVTFDGDNDFISSLTSITHDGEFTYEGWFRINSANTGTYSLLRTQGFGGTPSEIEGSQGIGGVVHGVESIPSVTELGGDFVEFAITDMGVLQVNVSNGGLFENLEGLAPINDDQWHHLAVTRDLTNGLVIYVDGFEEIVSGSPQFSVAFFDGFLSLGNSDNGAFSIDELRIWDRARSQEEILLDIETTIPPASPGLQAYYRFDQIVGSDNLPDLSGNGINGSLTDFEFNANSGWITSEALFIESAQNALNFDGVNDYISATSTNLNVVNGDYSLQAWVRPSIGSSANPGFRTVAAWDLSVGLVRLILNNGIPFFVMDDGNVSLPISGDEALTEGQWNHLAITMEGTSASLYLDGVLQINVADGMLVSSTLDNFLIGSDLDNTGTVPGNLFEGDIDELSVWNRALSETEIRNNLFKELDPGSTGLVANYNFNQGRPELNNSNITELLDNVTPAENGMLNDFMLSGTTSNFVVSDVFESFTSELSVFLDDGTQVTNAGLLNLGIELVGNQPEIFLALTNTGLDTLEITDMTFSSNLVQQRFLIDNRLDPFESDTIIISYDVINPITDDLDITFTIDEIQVFTSTFQITGYPNLPGAGNTFLLQGSEFASSVGSSTDLNGQSFSIEYWALRNDNSTEDYAFGHGTGPSTTNEQLHVGFRAGDIVTFSFFGNDLDFNWSEANDHWNHFAFTYDAATNERLIYINGNLMAQDVAAEDFLGSGQFFVGQAEFGQPFNGDLDELRVWNVELDEATIRRNLAKKLDNENLPLDSLIAYYRFDDQNFDAGIADLTGNYLLLNNGGISSLSSANFGDQSVFTYSENMLTADAIGQPIKVDDYQDPSQGVHLYEIINQDALPVDANEITGIFTDGIFGVFAPNGNTFSFKAGLGGLPDNDSLRIATRMNQTDPNWVGASDLFGTDLVDDSIRVFNRASSEFSLGELQYPLNVAFDSAGRALTGLVAAGDLPIESPNDAYGDFTIEYWINTTTLDNLQVFRHLLGVNGRNINVGINNGGRLVFVYVNETNTILGDLSGNNLVADGEWHHVAFVRNGTTASVYVDGILDNSQTGVLTGDLVSVEGAQAFIRADANTQVDEFRIWNSALTVDELRNHAFTNDLTNHPQRDAIAAYYRFDDDIASTRVVDLIGYNNGTLNANVNLVTSGAFATENGMVVSLADNGPGSLRDLIEEANVNPGSDTIRFNLPGTGPWQINLTSEILVTDSLVIEGDSQPGFDLTNNLMVELNGAGIVGNGIAARTLSFELYSLRFNDFVNAGFSFNSLPVGSPGNVQIGAPARGNVFINNGIGIQLGDNSVEVRNNFIGVTPDRVVGPNTAGVFIAGLVENSIIGGSLEDGNIISFNQTGVLVSPDAVGNLIRGNQMSENTLEAISLSTGSNNGILPPQITILSDLEVVGRGIAGQEVDVYLANIESVNGIGQGEIYLGTTTVEASGDWNFGGLSLIEGDFIITTANTIADGTSAFSGALRLNANPGVTIDDLITNIASPELTGTINDPEATILVNIDAEPAISAVNNGDGTWALSEGSIGPLAEGIFLVNVIAIDSLDNSGSASMDLIIDFTPPTVPTINNLATNELSPTLTGTFEEGTTLTVDINGNIFTLSNATTTAGFSSDLSGNWSLNLSQTSPVVVLPEVAYDVILTSEDAAGNVSMDDTIDELIIDSTTPAITINSLITNIGSPELTGTVVDDDVNVEINVTVDGQTYVANNDGVGNWTLLAGTITPSLTDGTYNVIVEATDAAGNIGLDSSSDELIIDSTAPVVTVNPISTNLGSPELTGTIMDVDVNASINITINGITYVATNNGNDTWTLPAGDITPALLDGTYDVLVQATDAAGNMGVDTSVDELIIDSALPDNPTVNTLITNNRTPILTGTFEQGTTLEINVNGLLFDLASSAELSDDGAGNWTLDLTTNTPLPEGVYNIIATTIDLGSNSVMDLTIDELTIDITAPVITVDNLVTSNTSPELTGNIDDTDATISVEVDGSTYTAINNGDNSWTLGQGSITPALITGTYDVIVSATDLAGNIGTDETADELSIGSTLMALEASDVLSNSFTANWELLPGVTDYEIDIALDDQFTDIVVGFEGLTVSANTLNVSGLIYNTTYFYRVRGIISQDELTGYSNVIEVLTTTSVGTIADMNALRRIYDEVGGTGWIRQTGWNDLNARIENYDGVTITDNRVTAIDLSGNNLTGSIPIFTGDELSQLNTFLLNDNNIADLPNLTSLTQLIDLQVQQNFLDFSDLEPNVGVSGIIYNEQNTLLESENLLENEGENIVLDRVVGGNANVYVWSQNGVAIDGQSDGTLLLDNISFNNDGIYTATVTNSTVPGLTLETNPINLRVSSLERDSISLRAVYDEMNGPNWTRVTNWETDPISAWQGIVIEGNRVTELDISENQVIGALPLEILDILSLSSLNISNNQIDSIPGLGSLTELLTVDISNNQIAFDDLEANVDVSGLIIGIQTLGDSPQNNLVRGGNSFDLSVSVAGINNVYQWMFDGVAIAGATAPNYQIPVVNRSSQGDYRCQITNTVVTGVEILSATNTITGIANISGVARVADNEEEFVGEGLVRLLAVRENAYDTIGGIMSLTSEGTYSFIDVPLDNYIISVDPTDQESFLPSYHEQSIQWDFATVVEVDFDTLGIDVNVERVPDEVEQGEGALTGEIFTDFADEGGRLLARRRVRRVGCALRRRRGQGRPEGGRLDHPNGRVEMDADGFELFSYQTTNDQGEFVFTDLPEGTYRLFIEYPGIPLREESFTEFEVGSNPNEDDFEVLVTVFDDGILIEQQNVVGIDDEIIDQLEIYPNPSQGVLFIDMTGFADQLIKIELIDLSGTIVLSNTIDNQLSTNGVTQLDITSISNGIYLVRVVLPNQQEQILKIEKLIVKGR